MSVDQAGEDLPTKNRQKAKNDNALRTDTLIALGLGAERKSVV